MISVDQAMNLRDRMQSQLQSNGPVMLSFVSGKGGVGKSSIVLNLGLSLGALGKKVLLVDMDLHTGLLDMLSGIDIRHNLLHVLKEDYEMPAIVQCVSPNVDLIASTMNSIRLSSATEDELEYIFLGIERLARLYDVVLIDTSAGVGAHQRFAISQTNSTILIINPDPSVLAGSYSFLREIELRFPEKNYAFIVNKVNDVKEAHMIKSRFTGMCKTYLQRLPAYIGMIPTDNYVSESFNRQTPCFSMYPKSSASRSFESIAAMLSGVKVRQKSWLEEKMHGLFEKGKKATHHINIGV